MTPRRLRGAGGDAGAALLLLLLLWRPLALHGITCPMPTSVEHADIRVKSYNLSSRERYTCNLGFKRKAGTSSLTECVFNTTTNTAHWTTPSLKCIRAHPYNSRAVAVAVPTSTGSVILLSGICVALFWARYRNVRSPSQTPSIEMENTEDAPMTGGTDGREEDLENCPYNL